MTKLLKPIVQVKNLQKKFIKNNGFFSFGRDRTEKIVLDKLSFEVYENEIWGCIGPNGAGKSSLIRVLSTLLIPDKGSVKIFGFDVVKEPHKIKELINRVSVDAAFYKTLSARENLIYSALLYGEESDLAELRGANILEDLGLNIDCYNERLEYMSRGSQQKVAITRALLSSPKLILLDEPTTGLDPRSKKIVQSFIKELKSKYKATIILASHDMQEVERLCDRVAFIDKGKFIVQGTIQELKDKSGSKTLEDAFIKLSEYGDDDVF